MSQADRNDTVTGDAADVSGISRDLSIVALAAAVVSTRFSSRASLAVSVGVLLVAGFVLAYRIKLLALRSV